MPFVSFLFRKMALTYFSLFSTYCSSTSINMVWHSHLKQVLSISSGRAWIRWANWLASHLEVQLQVLLHSLRLNEKSDLRASPGHNGMPDIRAGSAKHYASGGESMTHMPQWAVFITESSKRCGITALCFKLQKAAPFRGCFFKAQFPLCAQKGYLYNPLQIPKFENMIPLGVTELSFPVGKYSLGFFPCSCFTRKWITQLLCRIYYMCQAHLPPKTDSHQTQLPRGRPASQDTQLNPCCTPKWQGSWMLGLV